MKENAQQRGKGKNKMDHHLVFLCLADAPTAAAVASSMLRR